jgi:hypothetical protein
MNTLNLSDSIFREVVHSTEWIADALNTAQGRSPTPADSQLACGNALVDSCAAPEHTAIKFLTLGGE